MISAHHGWGEELVLYAAATGSAAIPAIVFMGRDRLARLVGWLRRR